ncbi:metalloprotease, partial [Coemansia sp. RSA 353]
MCTPEFVERQTTSNLTYYMFDGPLEQSVGDTRQHQLIKLPNNMVVLCTSDPDSAKAAASLSVNVGSMADPKEFPGMAHFLEHMLFMGSAKYPTENEYTEYIANNLDVQKHIETVFSAAYFKMLVVGNFEPAEAVDAAQQVNQMLKSQPLPAQSHVPSRMVNIEPGHYIYRHM